MMKIVSRLFKAGVTLGVCLLMGSIAPSTADAVGITIQPQNNSPVDIVLCAGKTDFNLDPFKDNLTAALVRAGVAKERINITASATKSFTSEGDGLKIMQEEWLCLPPGTTRPYMNGIELYGPSPLGILICNESEINGKVAITMDFTWWCAVHVGGFSPRLTKLPSGDYAGYWISLEAPDSRSQSDYGAFGSKLRPVLYKVNGFGLPRSFDYKTNPIGNAFTNGTVLKSGDWVPQTSERHPHKSKCTLEGNQLKVWLDGKLCLEYDLELDGPTYPAGTMAYGLSNSVHIGLSAVTFEMGQTTPLIDAIRSPNYQPTSDRFIIDVCDKPRKDFAQSEMMGELAQRMLVDDAYYIGWGMDESKASLNSFIMRLGSHGKYLPSRAADIYDQTARYIEPIVNRRFNSKDELVLEKDSVYQFHIIEE